MPWRQPPAVKAKGKAKAKAKRKPAATNKASSGGCDPNSFKHTAAGDKNIKDYVENEMAVRYCKYHGELVDEHGRIPGVHGSGKDAKNWAKLKGSKKYAEDCYSELVGHCPTPGVEAEFFLQWLRRVVKGTLPTAPMAGDSD